MDSEFLIRHWAPLVAILLLLAVAMHVSLAHLQRSASGQLRRALGELQAQRRTVHKAVMTSTRAESRLDRMLQKAEKIRPSELQAAKEALQDARALQKIAEDRLMVAENHVRRIIHEEFPPVKQQKLRARYLPEALPERRPFSF